MSMHRLIAVCASLFLAVPVAASETGAAPAPAPDADPITYTVKRGDTLYAISQRFLTGSDAVHELQRINRVSDPRRLAISRTLKIPRRLLRFEEVQLRIAAFSGQVTIADQPASQGAILREGHRIVTGANSFVSFSTRFGGRIALPSNSSARLLRARRYLLGNTLDVDFALDRGRGSANSPALEGQDRLRMRTPLAVTAVRGTEFRVAYDAAVGSRSLTEVIEGSVAVAAGGQERDTPAGFGVSSSDQGVSQPEELLPPPAIVDPGAIQTGEALEFTLEPQPEARGARVQLARDAGFFDIVSEQIIDGDRAVFASLDDNRYFVRARSISASGLEGGSEVFTFRRKRLGVNAGAGDSAELGGFLFQWLSESAGSGPSPRNITFAFQLWKAGQADTPLVDETGLDTTQIVLTDLEPGTYEWRVAAMEADPEDGLVKVWGPVQNLTISD